MDKAWHSTPWECPECDDGGATTIEFFTSHRMAKEGVAFHKDEWRCPNGHHGWVRVVWDDHVEFPVGRAEA